MTETSVRFRKQWGWREDPRGTNTRIYPVGITAPVADLVAAYLVAAGIAALALEASPEMFAEIEAQKQIIAALEHHGIEPTLDAVLAEISALLAQQQGQKA